MLAAQECMLAAKEASELATANFVFLWPPRGFPRPSGRSDGRSNRELGLGGVGQIGRGRGIVFRSTNHRLGEPALGRHREEKTVRHKSRTAS
jgi:hypothetical protein